MADELISRQATIKVMLNELLTSNNRVRDYIGGGIDRAVVKLQEIPSVNAVVLPCEVGDTLYDIYEAVANGEGNIRVLKVTEIHIHLDKRNKAWLIVGGYYFAIDDFGKTVFRAREEAEKALGERKEDNATN